VRYGWQARGSGYIGTVTAEGLASFEERLTTAARHLIEAQKIDPEDPAVYDCEIQVGKGLGFGKERLQKLFEKGLEVDPAYYPLYSTLAPCLLPRWYGEPEDVAKFLDDVLERFPGDEGLAIYARVVGDIRCYESSTGLLFMGIDMEKVQAGTKVLRSRYPYSNQMLNLACWVACERRDREAARDLFGWIGDLGDMRFWRDEHVYRRVRNWAFDDQRAANEERSALVSFQRLTAVAFSPDGKTIAVGSREPMQQVSLWDAEKCERIAVLPHPTHVHSVDFSPDGKRLATAGGAEAVAQLMLWNLGEEELDAKELEGPIGEVACVRFSPDGKLLAAGGADDTVWLWKLDDTDSKPEQIKLQERIFALDFSPNSEYLAIATEKISTVVPVATREPIFVNSLQHNGVADISLTNDECLVSGESYLLSRRPLDSSKSRTLKMRRSLPFNAITCAIDVSPDSKLVAAAVSLGRFAGTDNAMPSQVILYDTEKNEQVGEFQSSKDRAEELRFSPNGKRIATVGWDGMLRIWNLPPLSAMSESESRSKESVQPQDSDRAILGPSGQIQSIIVERRKSNQ
jgi:WD40 repeat protein